MGNPYAPKRQQPKNLRNVDEPQEESVEKTEVDDTKVPDGTAAEVLEWVGDDKDRAKQALEAEEAGDQRVGLTKKLKELA